MLNNVDKAINMIDREIALITGLKEGCYFSSEWVEADDFFKQFNKKFLDNYRKLGNYKFIEDGKKIKPKIKRKKVKLVYGSFPLSKSTIIKLNHTLKALDSTKDHSYPNLSKLLKKDIEKISVTKLNFYIFRLVDAGAITLIARKPRLYEVLKKKLD